ncbi:MBL fold metallo-hydrolase [Ammoniphilus sp. CFH 90114]|uniref:MBL fold metallo-hydrolase n=1 Tax=Ammoniphilus sp. CFH 90114 TaxID=2493665 RepID=UPI00100E2A0A|nr:MBL fold metallo-hydrolase [Ammoniphilus sp. CFH 90114]RXT15251.1 MBL fold metallo-hydrolase [Ammoniphilus sp. CFH 90114]
MRRKRFSNMDETPNKRTWDHFVRWQKSRRSVSKDYSFVIPNEPQPNIDYLQANRTDNTMVWIGHATFLVQMGGMNIVTDPVWANRMAMAGRLTPPGIGLSEMPEIDLVLISHSHYDHLHFKSIRGLRGNPSFLVPEGLGVKFLYKGFNRVEEFTWWDTKKINNIEISFVPAQHWSKRTPWDTNASHWGGWVIKDLSKKETIYFAGDSGYFPGFREIGKRFDVDFCLMPIGAYEPEWFMGMQHVSPEEAVQAFLDLKGTTFIPMHYSTFRLADDTPWEAMVRLQTEWKRRGLEKNQLAILKLGEILKISSA